MQGCRLQAAKQGQIRRGVVHQPAGYAAGLAGNPSHQPAGYAASLAGHPMCIHIGRIGVLRPAVQCSRPGTLFVYTYVMDQCFAACNPAGLVAGRSVCGYTNTQVNNNKRISAEIGSQQEKQEDRRDGQNFRHKGNY